MDTHIEGMLSAIRLGEPSACGALTLLPVFAPQAGGPRYVTLGEAMEAGTLTVTEVDRGGSVPELAARNDGGTSVLILAAYP
ncbi:MAG: hypothetical protein FDZ70_06585 [Actinobacteria bacterium]|nr:MAG: hypothetical protein FDZ70_06585 [Actinomycetota bacterium]